jgi:PKD repeat protein
VGCNEGIACLGSGVTPRREYSCRIFARPLYRKMPEETFRDMTRSRDLPRITCLTVVVILALLLGVNFMQSVASVRSIEVSPSSLGVASLVDPPIPAAPHGLSGSGTNGPTGTPPSVVATSSTPYWTNLTAAPSPSSRYLAPMAYDQADHYDLLFGGQWNSSMNDTWTFANGVWTDITSTSGTPPAAQYGMAMTYDPADGYVLAFGCSPSTYEGVCNDTWSFSHGKWSEIAAVDSPSIPWPTSGLSMTYDATDSYVFLYSVLGGQTWKYSGGVWTPFANTTNGTRFIPGPDLDGVATYDAHEGYVLFFGSQVSCSGCNAFGSYTWKFSGGVWTNITASVGASPPARFTSSMVFDNSSEGVVLFGGSNYDGQPLNDTWLFQNGTWHNVSASPSPPARYEGSIAYDPADSGVVLFGGIGSSGTDSTWLWGSNPPITGLAIQATPSTPLPGATVTFTSSFRGGVGSFSYSWEFGDGGTSSLGSPTHTFSTGGYYDVQVWVNDSAGHSANTSLRVHVYVPLALSPLRATPNPAVLGQPVNFSVNASGGTRPYTYSWNFGDGGVGGNLSNITHIYTTNGPFVAQVSVVDALGGSAHATFNISIKLQALAGSTTSSGAPPLTVDFVGQAQGGVAPYHFEWSFGDGATSPDQNPSHTYNSSGQFDVVLTVSDSRDNRSTSSLTVQVGVPSTGGSGEPGWWTGLVVAIAVAVAVGATWTASALYQRSRRREGERWIDELTREQPPQQRGPPR